MAMALPRRVSASVSQYGPFSRNTASLLLTSIPFLVCAFKTERRCRQTHLYLISSRLFATACDPLAACNGLVNRYGKQRITNYLDNLQNLWVLPAITLVEKNQIKLINREKTCQYKLDFCCKQICLNYCN